MTKSTSSEPLPSRVHPFDALATIGCVYLALVTVGFAAFRYLNVLPIGAKHNQDLTFFYSASTVSLTGFTHVNAAASGFPTFGCVLISSLAIGSTLTTLIGGGYLFARALRWTIAIRAIIVGSVALVTLPFLAGLVSGWFDSTSAATGLGIVGESNVGGGTRQWLVACSAPGLVGAIPLLALLRKFKRSREAASDVARCVSALALLYLIGLALLVACGLGVVEASTQSLNLRALGLAGPRVDATEAMPWAITLLSTIGAMPASTAGGLSVLPIVITLGGAIAALRGQAIDARHGVAVGWLFAFAVIAISFVIGLAALAPALPADRLLSIVFAALGNVGVSQEPIGMTGTSLFLLSGMMLTGRLLPLIMLAWMASVAERTRYEV